MKLSNRTPRAFVSLAATASLVAGGVALAAAPAQADASVTGYANGSVGVPMYINVANVDGCNNLNFVATYSNGVSSSAPEVFVNFNGNATIVWTPPQAGSVSSATIGSTCSPISLSAVNIAGVSTTTTIVAPNTAKVGQGTKITVNVTSASPSTYSPQGTVTVVDAQGGVIQNMGLTPNGNGQSYAYWLFTPATVGSYSFQATYNPVGGSPATGSTSAADIMYASQSGNTISLSLPPSLTVGVPTTLQANLVPSSLVGSVGFTVNGQPISASIPIQNGTARFNWTPNAAGNITIGASYTTNQGGSGSTSQPISVVAGPVSPDTITLSVPGVATWLPNGTYNIGAGSSTTFTATSLSGSPVVLSETGPCALSGTTLTAGPNGSRCNLTAKSNGGNGYAPVTYGYAVAVGIGQQTANVNPPISGRVNKGKAIVLEGPGQGDTNAGQNIVWSVRKSSKKICKLGFPADGSVTVKLVKNGSCTVTGKAPGVPGQWSPYAIARTYRA